MRSIINELGGVAAAAGKARAALATVVAVEQLSQQDTAHLVHCRPHLELCGPKVQPAAAALGKKALDYLLDLARDLRLDDLGKFF